MAGGRTSLSIRSIYLRWQARTGASLGNFLESLSPKLRTIAITREFYGVCDQLLTWRPIFLWAIAEQFYQARPPARVGLFAILVAFLRGQNDAALMQQPTSRPPLRRSGDLFFGISAAIFFSDNHVPVNRFLKTGAGGRC